MAKIGRRGSRLGACAFVVAALVAAISPLAATDVELSAEEKEGIIFERQQRMEAFVRNSEIMAKAGETGNVIAVTGLMIDGMPCKQCHDVFRTPKKP